MAWATSKHRGSTRLSRTQRAHVLRMWPTCYLNYPGCTTISTEDDHVIPLHKGGSDDLGNRRGTCHHCHGVKTRAEALAARPTRRRPAEQHPGIRHPQ